MNEIIYDILNNLRKILIHRAKNQLQFGECSHPRINQIHILEIQNFLFIELILLFFTFRIHPTQQTEHTMVASSTTMSEVSTAQFFVAVKI